MHPNRKTVAIIGGGFTGLAAAYELAAAGIAVTVFEADDELGGLAGTFPVGTTRLEKFYHHWFTNDRHVLELVAQLDADDQVHIRPTATGMYYANRLFRLAAPLDLLRFTALSLLDRIRLGLLVFKARMHKDWEALDDISAADWLRRLAGPTVYRVVWEPLLAGKFGDHAENISAAWFWAKLVLRGGSRGKGGNENLAYFTGGFQALADRMAAAIEAKGGTIHRASPVGGLVSENGRIVGLRCGNRTVACDAILSTVALPVLAQLVDAHAPSAYVADLRKVGYLANICLVLLLDRSLSGLYWMNVNDPDFPFVGIIEHTNFEPPESYGGQHVVYLSKYLPPSAPLYRMDDDEVLAFALPHIQRMFPKFQREWIRSAHVWRAPYAQAVVSRGYSRLVPKLRAPVDGLYVATMAQIYPEDRGTNYAVRDGRAAARAMLADFSGG